MNYSYQHLFVELVGLFCSFCGYVYDFTMFVRINYITKNGPIKPSRKVFSLYLGHLKPLSHTFVRCIIEIASIVNELLLSKTSNICLASVDINEKLFGNESFDWIS